MKSIFYYIMVVAVFVAVVAPIMCAEQQAEEPDSLLSNLEGNADSKPFNLQGANTQRRAHGIYFNGR
ncbi:hypothetical protein Ocin01_01361 [Orchesella cincta]|uniref:Uncharacterized protein n=1 Tax=Orchesella cincta TaxID=48709 RepID=A0A1D2NJ87_ORCCI|nr:hypothetical protein Ocin01_01361 [Orchesella cincta]